MPPFVVADKPVGVQKMKDDRRNKKRCHDPTNGVHLPKRTCVFASRVEFRDFGDLVKLVKCFRSSPTGAARGPGMQPVKCPPSHWSTVDPDFSLDGLYLTKTDRLAVKSWKLHVSFTWRNEICHAGTMGNLRVLAVDDEQLALDDLTWLLGQSESISEVLTARSGMKPVAQNRLDETVRRIAASRAEAAGISAVAGSLARLNCRTGNDSYLVERDDVSIVEASGDYVRAFTGDTSHLLHESISSLTSAWSAAGFIRIHRSYLIRSSLITEVRTTDGRRTVIVDGRELPVSRRYSRLLQDHLAGPPGRA